jgi:hypothetical protein
MYLCLSFSKKQLHTFFYKLWVRDEFELNGRTISRAEDSLRVVHSNDSNSLSNSLYTVGQIEYHTLRLHIRHSATSPKSRSEQDDEVEEWECTW